MQIELPPVTPDPVIICPTAGFGLALVISYIG